MRRSIDSAQRARRPRGALLATALVASACSSGPPTGPDPVPEPEEVMVPLTELANGTYLGFVGGLYADGRNEPGGAHLAEGMARARAIRPLNVDGNPAPAGAYILLSIGMSNTTQEFCGGGSANACKPWTFMGQAAADPEVRRTGLVLIDGAKGGEPAAAWDAPNEANYDRVRDQVLAPQGFSEAQVQIAWIKQANPRPSASLPDPDADAFVLLKELGEIVRALAIRYPNLQQVLLSSRVYAGFATTTLNPEPYAYESGFAVKWLVEAQARQADTDQPDPAAGDLRYSTAPWLGWGPYLWAAGTTPRSDGLSWTREDFEGDGTHPSRSGEEKVGRQLLEFLKSAPYTRCWFVEGERC